MIRNLRIKKEPTMSFEDSDDEGSFHCNFDFISVRTIRTFKKTDFFVFNEFYRRWHAIISS